MMQVEMVKSKIHRVTVTESNLDYIGSITIDQDLMDAATSCPANVSTSSTTTTANVSTPTP